MTLSLFQPISIYRITVEEALQHPYLSVWHDPADEPVCPVPFDFSFESEDSTEGMKRLIVEEVRSFRRMVRQPPREAARRKES